jgi:hypothetical protein
MLHHSKNHAKTAGLSLSQDVVEATKVGPRRCPKSNHELMSQLSEHLKSLKRKATDSVGRSSKAASYMFHPY